MNYSGIKINFHYGSGDLKTSFGPIGPKDLSSCESRTLFPIFRNKAPFYPQ